MKKTNVQCVDMVRKIRDNLYLETKSMSDTELLEFYSQENKKPEKKIKNKKVA